MKKTNITWKELCEYCKKRGAKIKKPLFGLGMQSIRFPRNSHGVGTGIFQNGSWGAWFENVNEYGTKKCYYVEYAIKPYYEIKEIVDGVVR